MWQLLAQAEAGGMRNTIDALARTPISIIVYIAAIATALRVLLYQITKDVPKHTRGGSYTAARIGNEALDAVVYALVFVFLLIRPFGIQAFTIPTGSMVPTLKINDFIVANKAVYRYSDPQVDDIVVFKPPPWGLLPSQQGMDIDYIKRVQGVPGDVVEVRNNILYRNGKIAADPHKHFNVESPMGSGNFRPITIDQVAPQNFKLVYYQGKYWPVIYSESDLNPPNAEMPPQFQPQSPADAEALRTGKPAAIPAGCLLMMGDNRNNSYDSRFWGLVERSRVIGRAEFIWLPFNRIGGVD